MQRYNEDEIRVLKHLTDEVFVISNKPQLAVVQKMKQLSCDIMSTGLQKVSADFFYCKTCDKERKYPICKKCAENCHKNHLALDFVQASEDFLSFCYCGFKCHAMTSKKKEEEIYTEQNSSKCYFNNLSLAGGLYEYYIGINGKKVCAFCYHFCCQSLSTNEDDEESRKKAFQKYQFRKMRVSYEEFAKGLESGQIVCDCLSLIDSRHKFSDYLFIYINDLNLPYLDENIDDNYFSHLSPTKIINLFFNSVELFESIYSNFILEYNEFMEGLSQKNDNLGSSASFGLGYANFSNNANNCNYNLYINEKINVYFTTTLTKNLLEKNLQMNEQNNIFLINYLRGYIKFRLDSYMEEMPRYLITDLFNINPFQRRIWRDKCHYIFLSSGLKKENLISTLISFIERNIRLKPDLEESIQTFIELFRIIKFYSRFFLLTKEEIIELCKILEDFFGFLSEFYCTEDSQEIALKDERGKLFKTIVKIITYLILYINDETLYSFFNLKNPFEEEEETEKIFFHSFTEASKLINKVLILLCHGIRQEYEVVTYLINKKKLEEKNGLAKQKKTKFTSSKAVIIGDEKNKNEAQEQEQPQQNEEMLLDVMTNEEYQILLMRTLHNLQINLDFTLQKKDVYMQGLLRSVNKNIPLYFELLDENYGNDYSEEKIKQTNFSKLIVDFSEHIESLYYDFFNSTHITLELIQEYVVNYTKNILKNFSSGYENIIDKQGNFYICDYSSILKKEKVIKENKMTCEFMLNKSPNSIYALTKIFKLSKEKSVFTEELCNNILKICFAFINDNPDNCLIGLSTPVLTNLTKMPRQYLCCILDYMSMGLQILIKYNCELSFGFFLAKFGFLIYHKSTENSKANKGKNLSNTYYCLYKLFQLLELLFTFNVSDQKQYLDFIKPNLQEFIEDDLIQSYKLYLLNIAKDFKKNKKTYTSKRIFDNTDIFDIQFQEFFNISNTFNSTLMFQIFFMFLKLTNKAFDVNALQKVPDFLKEFFSAREILDILEITTLFIPLRMELIKYFRMIYIDLSIDVSKMEEYRFKFHEELDTEVQEIADNLLSVDSMKVFVFLQRLLKVSNYNYESENAQYEYRLIFNEVRYFKKIITNSKHCDKKEYMSYIENGIILPVKIYLNKVFSLMMTIHGEGLLQLYRFCYYVLKMKEFIIERNIISNIPEEDRIDSVFKNQYFTNEGALEEVKEDLENITHPSFSVLNYKDIYVLINKHVMSLVDDPTSSELVLYLSEYEKYEQKEKKIIKEKLEKHGINLEMNLYKNAWEAYETYVEQKNNFDKSSLKANFDDTLIGGEVTIRTIVLKYLLFLSTNKAGIFEEEGVNMLLKLLKNEPDESQASIFQQNEKEENNNNLKKVSKKEQSKKADNNNNTNQKLSNFRERQIEDICYMAKSCFDYILASIFSQYNPTSLELSDEYYNACHIIKIFKYLCEAHNQYFQKRLMNEVTFSISSKSKINFYDMMLFVVDKIIVISSWEQSKTEDDAQDYFYGLFSCLIELLIEIIRGSDSSNFKSFFNDEDEEHNLHLVNGYTNEISSKFNASNKDVNKDQKTIRNNIRQMTRKKTRRQIDNDYKYEKGKSLKLFLKNISRIMFENTSENETIFSVKKNLMDFILSFMEEANCPRKIKNLIMSCYHPHIIIKSICTVLKLYYLKKIRKKNENEYDIGEGKNKRVRINQIVEQNLVDNNNLDNNNDKNEKKTLSKILKQLKFNEDLCNMFLDLYFEDTEFSETGTFALCNGYFKYFILTYIQFKNEETIDFWNRVHNQTEETLSAYNKRTKNSLNFDKVLSTVNDESDLEAYYVIKLFNEISKHILVKIKPDVPPIFVIYTIHPYSKYLSSDSKDEFLRTVDRKNRYSKLYDLIESSEYFKLEIIYNWNYLRKNALLRKSTEINYHMIGYLTFLVSLILNLVLLICLHDKGNNFYGNNVLIIVDIISYIFSGLILIVIIFWFLTKYQLYFEIEKAKYKEHHYDVTGLDDSQLKCSDKFVINYEAIMGKGELNPFFIYVIFTLLGSTFENLRFFYSFSLLSVVSLNQTLNNIALSLVLKGNSLAWTSLFTIVLLYEYAGWAFYFQRDRFYETNDREKPDEMCRSLLYCFLTMINNGMRWHCGVGKITRSESYILHFWPFVHRFVFDLLFFWLIEAIMLKIVYGIILDSFGELRQAHYLIEKDMANNCFICNVEKDECEKNNISFKEHCEEIHNVWDYAFYMITLRMREPSSLNALNARNRKRILEKGVDWLPDSSLDKLEDIHQKNDDDEESTKD